MMVRTRGLEPPLPCGNMNLNHARLPVPPCPRALYTQSGTKSWFLSPSCLIINSMKLEPESNQVTPAVSRSVDSLGKPKTAQPPQMPPAVEFGSKVVQPFVFTERTLIGRFHANAQKEPGGQLAKRVFDLVRCGHLTHEHFYIPVWKKVSPTFGGYRRGESDAHMIAKASISKWLYKTHRAVCAFEVDGIDVVWEKKKVWAECGNTSMIRFDWLLAGRCSQLLIVDKPATRDKQILVQRFTATSEGSAAFKAQRDKEMDEAMQRLHEHMTHASITPAPEECLA